MHWSNEEHSPLISKSAKQQAANNNNNDDDNGLVAAFLGGQTMWGRRFEQFILILTWAVIVCVTALSVPDVVQSAGIQIGYFVIGGGKACALKLCQTLTL